jgi:hypothetical protein
MPPPDPAAAPADLALCARVPLGLGPVVQVGGDGALAAWLAARDPCCRLVRVAADAIGDAPTGAGLVVLHAPSRDAAAAIRDAALLLAPDGVLLVDAPNAEHWRLAQRLLVGGAAPAALPAGAMTREGLLAAVRGAGLVPLDVPSAVPEAEAAEDFARQIAPGLTALGTDAAAYLRRAGPPRWLLRAARQAPVPLMLLAHVLKPVGGVNTVRVDMPLGAVATHPGIALRIGERPETPQLADGVPRILILHRRLLNTPEAPAFINHFRRRGWVVVQEFDDDPAHWPVIAGSDHFAFRGVHAVQTSTPKLEALFRGFNDEVVVFPNTVAALPEPRNFADPSRLTLFLGALRREEDTAPYLDALNAVLAEAAGRLAVEVVFDRSTFEALRTPHKRFHPLLPYAEYRALMGACEIAFLPLAETRFNGFKSDLKFVEAGAHRLCCLASPVVYGMTIRDGETGFIVDGPAALGARLREMLAAPERALAVGDAARRWVRENRLVAQQVPARLAWYRGLWERRAALDAALVKRAPEVVGD